MVAQNARFCALPLGTPFTLVSRGDKGRDDTTLAGARVREKRTEVDDVILAGNGNGCWTRTGCDNNVYLHALVGLKSPRCWREAQAGAGITRDRPREGRVETVVKATSCVLDRHDALTAIRAPHLVVNGRVNIEATTRHVPPQGEDAHTKDHDAQTKRQPHGWRYARNARYVRMRPPHLLMLSAHCALRPLAITQPLVLQRVSARLTTRLLMRAYGTSGLEVLTSKEQWVVQSHQLRR